MKDSRYEAFLKRQGVDWTYAAEVPLADIDIDAHAKDNIRLGQPLDQETVLRYALAIEEGAEFPALLLYRRGARYAIANGMHRVEAYQLAKQPRCDAYILNLDAKVDAVVLERIQRTVNIVEGKAPSQEEAIEQALWLVSHLGYSDADAARMLHLKPRIISGQRKARLAVDRLLKGAPDLTRRVVEEFGVSRLEILDSIKRDPHAIEAARIAHAARLTVEEVRELSRQVRDAASDDDCVAVLARWRHDLRTRIGETAGGRIRPPASPLRDARLYFQKLERAANEQLEGRSRSDMLQFLKQIRRTVDKKIAQLEQALAAEKRRPAARTTTATAAAAAAP